MNSPIDDATAAPRAATTCGPLFLRAARYFIRTTDPRDPVSLFSAGHMCGQAEKIYLGACKAAMFRPSPEYHQWALTAAIYLSKVYGLQVSVFDHTEISDEIWLHAPDAVTSLGLMSRAAVNSPEWHMWRGLLCGIPFEEIDLEFHKRKGYREPCDRVESATSTGGTGK